MCTRDCGRSYCGVRNTSGSDFYQSMTKKSVFFSMKLASLSLGAVNWAGLRESLSEQLAVHEKGDLVHYVKVLLGAPSHVKGNLVHDEKVHKSM